MLLILTSACSQHGRSGDGVGTGSSIDVASILTGGELDSAVPDPLLADGLELYKGQYCGICHEFRMTGSLGSSGPTHEGIGLTAAKRVRDPKYTGDAKTAEEYLRESIVIPTAYLVPGYERTMYRMPAYTTLSDSEVEALVQLLLRDN